MRLKLTNPVAEAVLAGLVAIREEHIQDVVDAMTAWQISTLIREMMPKVQTFAEQKQALWKKYGTPMKLKARATKAEKEQHEKNKPLEVVGKLKQKKFQAELQPLLEKEISFSDVDYLEVSKLPTNVKWQLIEMIHPVIAVPKKPKPKAKAKAKTPAKKKAAAK